MPFPPLKYATRSAFTEAPHKNILFFSMSGLGKTHLAKMLRGSGEWFHYSIDYRIGTRYMGEFIADNAKAHAMKVPFLRELLMSDSIYIGSNITFDNLAPVSAYLGKPGNEAEGGVPIEAYRKRQDQFRRAEIAALADSRDFIDRSHEIYGYPHFVCDTGGSICEWVNPNNSEDPLLTRLAEDFLLIWIKGDEAHTEELIRRFDKAPKPMAYQPEFLARCWEEYLAETGLAPDRVNPDRFVRWTYAKALAHRQPLYEAMAQNWGITIPAAHLENCTTADQIITQIAHHLPEHG